MNRNLINISFNRLFHISSHYNGQAKTMRKIMGETKKKKFKYRTEPLLSQPSTFTVGANEGKKSSNTRRVNVLNKLFMRYITDLMSTGECSSAFVGHGIEINNVQITSDFSCVRIYWSTKNVENKAIEEILTKNVGILRHELAQLKIVGVVPSLQFVRDKQFARLAQVDKLLSEADYGDDHVPLELTARVKAQLQLNTSLNSYMQKIEKLDKTSNEECDGIPSMPNDVFGLNHSKIMEEITSAAKKSKAIHRDKLRGDLEPTTLINKDPIQFTSEQEEKEAFRQFLQKQQIMKSKMQRDIKKQIAELERVETVWIEQQEMENETVDEKDFIDDDFDSFNKS
ncbi:hypothetical protein PPYR_00850 [Photinus pyralis]|uniref:Ribosome-binding factor A, mitochondrial n=3 Tax=Photinus pyralis TaxID=7054 RepID=A0A1Y1JX99_PHOPY|nr:uncharacterized protein LOC116158765 [Photinus pyralis]KAB0803880.1 hypothetical protein PPYR_00850 [Photinus pyralis]